MDGSKRCLTFFTFFVCAGCLGLLTAAFATQYWLVAEPRRLFFGKIDVNQGDRPQMTTTNHSSSSSSSVAVSWSSSLHHGVSSEAESTKFQGKVNFGLFEGKKVLDHGYGPRKTYISIKPEMSRNPELMIFGLWLFTVLCLGLAILFGLVSAVAAIVNTVMTPVEVITGIQGLFLWNGLGALFTLSAIVSWVVQFNLKLKKNVLTREEVEDQWVSEGKAWYGCSFYFAIGALVLYVFNMGIVYLAIKKPWEHRKPKPALAKNPEGVIMLY